LRNKGKISCNLNIVAYAIGVALCLNQIPGLSDVLIVTLSLAAGVLVNASLACSRR
jgi:hypothetical protein